MARFDERRQVKFITYAVWWIRQRIRKALAERTRIVRTPLSRAGDLRQIQRRIGQLSQHLGREPSCEEIAASAQLSVERTQAAIDLGQPDTSLNALLSGDSDRELSDISQN